MLVSPEATLRDALVAFDESGIGVALVVNKDRRLLGLLTIGDLRRALISGSDATTAVAGVMNRDPVTAPETIGENEILRLVTDEIRHVPLLDNERRVVGLASFKQIQKKIPWAVPEIGEEELREVIAAVRSGWLTMGPRTRKLEELFADYVGRKHAIAVSNGTAALDIALKILEVGPGDEVIIPALTYIATANAVTYQGATIVLADVDPVTFNMDPVSAEAQITDRTKVIMPIDYCGNPSSYGELLSLANRHGITLLQDGAESLGGEYDGRRLNSFGQISTLSFHAAKVMTSIEGGMLFTDDDQIAHMARVIRNQGEDPDHKYLHVALGHNYRLTDLHAAIGLAQFGRLDHFLSARRKIAAYYSEALADLQPEVTLPSTTSAGRNGWFSYPILLDHRDEVAAHLGENGVDTRIAWPKTVHHQPIYERQFTGCSYPVAESIASRVLNLPLYTGMQEEEQNYVVLHLRDVLSRTAEIAGVGD